ncbi:MAG: TatD family hydrolase [Candidatus Omnitrophica bacterium]|nr:TatD family hydrolase [Candidatus Omnitrophota bacterium]
MIDAHAHVQDERLKDRRDAVIARARQAGISAIVCCGTGEADWPSVLMLARQYPDIIIPSFGVHPGYVHTCSPAWRERLEDFLAETASSAVGEIGLDFAREEFDSGRQREVFIAQLALAKKYNRPVSIHCRKAWEVLIGILKDQGPFEHGGIIHSYSGTPYYVPILCELGLSISFSGSITRANNKKGRTSLMSVPLEHLVVETDSPDIVPAGVEGVNEPANLVFAVKTIAALLGRGEADIARITADNTRRIFRKP